MKGSSAKQGRVRLQQFDLPTVPLPEAHVCALAIKSNDEEQEGGKPKGKAAVAARN